MSIKKKELKPHIWFNFAINPCVDRSKFMEKRCPPDQIILAAMAWCSCLFLSLAVLMKLYNDNPSLNDFYISSALGDCWQYKSMDDIGMFMKIWCNKSKSKGS